MLEWIARRYWLVLALLVLPAASTSIYCQEHHWGYEGEEGPKNWYRLDPAFAECKLGKEESPLNIEKAQRADLPAIQFSYQSSKLAVVNNGHTIEDNYAPGSTITIGDKSYELVEFHFHHLSETTMKGKHAPMEVHLVHRNSEGKLAVVAVLLHEGAANKVVEAVWQNIPLEKNKPNTPDVQVNAADLLPSNHLYYTFAGSLTTPPCTEGVTWFVLAEPITVSKEQIAIFAKLYPHDFRPTQPLNNRVIKEGGQGN